MDQPKNPPRTSDRLSALLSRAPWREILPSLAIVVVLLIAVAIAGREIAHHLEAIEVWVARRGAWGVLILVAMLILGTSLLLPESLFAITAGALFGPLWGTAAVISGNLIAAAMQYGLAHRLLRERIDRTLAARPSFAAIRRAVLRDELRLQVLLRLTPLHPALISYLLGAAGVRFPKFLLACLALTPHLLLEVYLGHAGHQVAGMVGSGRAAKIQDLTVLGGLLVALVMVVAISRVAHRAVLQAVAETDDGVSPEGAP